MASDVQWPRDHFHYRELALKSGKGRGTAFVASPEAPATEAVFCDADAAAGCRVNIYAESDVEMDESDLEEMFGFEEAAFTIDDAAEQIPVNKVVKYMFLPL